MTTYKEAGVDIEAGDQAVKNISKLVKNTFNKNTLIDIGGFGGCYLFPKDKYDNPVLVSSADGVGTKLNLAFMQDKHDTIGQCLVNHCTNDILAIGAQPLFFLDYFAAGKLNQNTLNSVVEGLTKACIENSCVLIGGETAEMPGFYKEGEYDISGTIIGVVEKEYMMPAKKVNTGDLLYALPSTGLHTNGYSLARNVLLNKFAVDEYVDSIEGSVGEALLSIHKSYLNVTKDILSKDWLVGISHITGGGIVSNTNRVIDANQDIEIDWGSWDVPAIFTLIQDVGKVSDEEMRKSMNMGLGIIYIVKPEGASEFEMHMSSLNQEFYSVGIVK